MSYLVIDLETTETEVYGRTANPWFNKILCAGLKVLNEKEPRVIDYRFSQLGLTDLLGITLVGHNLKFDLLYLWELDPPRPPRNKFRDIFQLHVRIWDTQLAEYILTGQRHKYPALRDIAVNKYGCKERVKHLQEALDSGKTMVEIDPELLLEDVKNDVLDTEQVYLQQVELAKEQGLLQLIELQMDALLATTEMEYNGFHVDTRLLDNEATKLNNQLIQANKEAMELIKPYWPNQLEFNLSSPMQLSYLFFGGTIKAKRKKDNDIMVSGLGIKPHPSWKTKVPGRYSTNEDVLIALSKKTQIGEKILRIRELEKQLSTYYTSTRDLTYIHDSCVHSRFSHCGYGDFGKVFGGTATGRLSCTGPNIQNQPKPHQSLVKKHFTSRFKGGKIIEADYTQLEPSIQAQLSDDPQYIADINNGVDTHCKRLALQQGITYEEAYTKAKIEKDPEWVEKRNTIKEFSFQRTYSAGAASIARNTGIDVDVVKELIANEEKAYPILKRYNDRLLEAVKKSARPTDKRTSKGNTVYEGFYTGPTGRRYYFETSDAPQWLVEKGVNVSFMPPPIHNYIVQGTATADIVLIMLGIFWRKKAQFKRDKYVLVNTVHDSIILDCKPEHLDEAKEDLKILDRVGDVMVKYFKMDWKVKIKTEVKIGDSWWDCGI